MSWMFWCDRCARPERSDGGVRRVNGEHASTLSIEYRSKNSPDEDISAVSDRVDVELCGECWNSHERWMSLSATTFTVFAATTPQDETKKEGESP